MGVESISGLRVLAVNLLGKFLANKVDRVGDVLLVNLCRRKFLENQARIVRVKLRVKGYGSLNHPPPQTPNTILLSVDDSLCHSQDNNMRYVALNTLSKVIGVDTQVWSMETAAAELNISGGSAPYKML